MGYTPLTPQCKFNLFLKQTYSPYTFVSAGFQATWDQAMGQWPHYGGGMQGWGKRFGATLADTESRRFIQTYALSTILHQDPRYFSSGKRAFIARAWYSTTSIVSVFDTVAGARNLPRAFGLATLIRDSIRQAKAETSTGASVPDHKHGSGTGDHWHGGKDLQ